MNNGVDWTKIRQFVCYVLFSLFVLLMISGHSKAGFTFPVPWPDESSFLWPAISFADNWNLFAGQLNESREIMWMPPGYAIICGIFFKLFSFSFDSARMFSLVALIAAFFFLVSSFVKHRLSVWIVIIAGAFFINRYFVLVGNLARMEAFVIMFACMGFWLITKKKWLSSLAVLAIAPLFHPNGFYFLFGGFVYLIGFNRNPLLESLKKNWFKLIPVLSLWAAYLVHVVLNWQFFLNDMKFQFALKDVNQNPFVNMLTSGNLLALMIFLCLLFPAFKYRRSNDNLLPLLILLGLPAWLIDRIGQLLWYQAYDSLAILSLVLSGVMVVSEVLESNKDKLSGMLRPVMIAFFCISCLFYLYYIVLVENPLSYPPVMQYSGMTNSQDVLYLAKDDRKKVNQYLRARKDKENPPLVQFFPRADAMFFTHHDGRGIRIWDPTFTDKKADIHIIHISKYLPWWWKERVEKEFSLIDRSKLKADNVLVDRDKTEQILVFDKR